MKIASIGMLFDIGAVRFTPRALEAFARVPAAEPTIAMRRHLTGDWGDADDEDKRANDLALKYGDRLFSVYRLSTGVLFWIVTEADRSVTTFLLPDDY